MTVAIDNKLTSVQFIFCKTYSYYYHCCLYVSPGSPRSCEELVVCRITYVTTHTMIF